MGRKRTGYLAAIASAVLFLGLAALVVRGLTAPFDDAARAGFHRYSSHDLTQLALLFSFIGSAWIWVPVSLVAIAVLLASARRRAALALFACMAGAVLLDNGLKVAFHRARPFGFFAADPRTFSFPSGHALFAACFYGALATILAAELRSSASRAVLWAAAILAMLCIGWSRLYLGVHYPSDVLAGYLAGAAWVQFLRAVRWFPAADATPLPPLM